MSISQISTSNTFGQLVITTSALVAVANNLTDGPAVVSNASWTFSNANVGINVGNTALITTANVGTLNLSTGNVSNLTVGNSNISRANITVANIGGATIGNINSTLIVTNNANVSILQVNTINSISMKSQTANIGSLSITSLNVTSLTVPVLNTSFANITDGLANTMQILALISTLVTTTNANVGILNSSTANITGATVGTLNVSSGNVTTLTVGSLNLSTANITKATLPTLNASFANVTLENVVVLNASTINVSNIKAGTLNTSFANITVGVMSANPTSNLGIATKQYVDLGAGGNVVNKLTFSAKGDVIVGTGANTFTNLGVGSNGQVLVVDTNQTTSLRWSNRGQTEVFRGLVMGSSQADKNSAETIIVINALDEVVMDDGEVVSGWTPMTQINTMSSGVNGLDTGSLLANTWYEIYAIRKRSDGSKGFILHRSSDVNPDQNTMNTIQWATGTYGSRGANTTLNPNTKFAMSFTPNVSGNLTSVEIRAFKTSTPTGNMWLTLEANTAGNPDGNALSTSRKLDVSRAQITNHYQMRFVFDNTAPVAKGTSYFWVFNSDYPASATAFMNVEYSTQAANGVGGVNPGVPMGNNGTSWVDLRPGVGAFIYKAYIEANANTLVYPTGYDQKCLISYTATDSNTKIRQYRQIDRTINGFFNAQWMGYATTQTTTSEVADLRNILPPIPCSATLFGWSAAGVAQYIGYGVLSCLDIPSSSYVETDGFMPGTCASTGSIASPTAPTMYIEQQAIVVRVSTAVTKFYMQSFTF